jgi:hypothetical protein
MVPGGTPNFNMRPEGGIMNSGANLNAGAHVFGAEGPQPQQEMNPQMMARIQAVRGGMIR